MQRTRIAKDAPRQLRMRAADLTLKAEEMLKDAKKLERQAEHLESRPKRMTHEDLNQTVARIVWEATARTE